MADICKAETIETRKVWLRAGSRRLSRAAIDTLGSTGSCLHLIAAPDMDSVHTIVGQAVGQCKASGACEMAIHHRYHTIPLLATSQCHRCVCLCKVKQRGLMCNSAPINSLYSFSRPCISVSTFLATKLQRSKSSRFLFLFLFLSPSPPTLLHHCLLTLNTLI